jgi:hypothetical protein
MGATVGADFILEQQTGDETKRKAEHSTEQTQTRVVLFHFAYLKTEDVL